ncbi:MAG: hypothetical protein AAF352_05135 [Pseudomonadota bacterium]
MGTRQSGLPLYRIADLGRHADLALVALQHAKVILEEDPQLVSEVGQRLRILLYLFARDEALGYVQAG